MQSAATARHVVCYHYPCIDGIFAALAAHLHFSAAGADVRFFPLTVFKDHQVEDLSLTPDDTLYLCDYAGPAGFVQAAAAKARSVLVLDHHKTALEQLQGISLPSNVHLHLDMSRSGATIALDFFDPPVPEQLRQAYRLVEDADLWTWKLPGSREFHCGLGALNLEFNVNVNPGIFAQLQNLSVTDLLASGQEAMQVEDSFIAAALSTAFPVQLGGELGLTQGWGQALAVRIPDDMSKHRSRLGSELCACSLAKGLRPIGVVAYREKGMADEPNTVKLSLRGQGDETDTTVVSSAFGGGGHRLASSCIVSEVAFQTWAVK